MSELTNDEIARHSQAAQDAIEAVRLSFQKRAEDGDRHVTHVAERALSAPRRDRAFSVAFELAASAHVGAQLLRLAAIANHWTPDETLDRLAENVTFEYLVAQFDEDES